MNNYVLYIFICLVTISCTENQPTTIEEVKNVVIEDTVAEVEIDSPEVLTPIKDSIPTHLFKNGETLWDLSRKYYGNRHYSSIMKIYNEIENVNGIKEGSLIKIPQLNVLLKDPKLKLYPFISDEMDKIIEARSLFMLHEKELYLLRKEQNMKQPLDIPLNIQKDILKAVDLINEAIVSLKTKEIGSSKHSKRMMEQLRGVSKSMKDLANGKHDTDYGYDIDMVHQKLIRSLHSSIFWSKEMEEHN